MSDKGKRKREWRCYVRDMIGFCEKVETWTEGLDREGFAADELVYDAVLRNLELVGAAAARVPDAIREAHPNVPWRAIVGMRNRLAHDYPGIDDNAIWSVIQDDIPVLVPALRDLLAAAGEGA